MAFITKSVTFGPKNADEFRVNVTANLTDDETEIESFSVVLGDMHYDFSYIEFVEVKRLFASFL